MLPIKIVATGLYAPGEPIDNQELKKLAGIEFNHEKLKKNRNQTAPHIILET